MGRAAKLIWSVEEEADRDEDREEKEEKSSGRTREGGTRLPTFLYPLGSPYLPPEPLFIGNSECDSWFQDFFSVLERARKNRIRLFHDQK